VAPVWLSRESVVKPVPPALIDTPLITPPVDTLLTATRRPLAPSASSAR
jgi:hypothetical protein